jgi:hypothetical protein
LNLIHSPKYFPNRPLPFCHRSVPAIAAVFDCARAVLHFFFTAPSQNGVCQVIIVFRRRIRASNTAAISTNRSPISFNSSSLLLTKGLDQSTKKEAGLPFPSFPFYPSKNFLKQNSDPLSKSPNSILENAKNVPLSFAPPLPAGHSRDKCRHSRLHSGQW